MKKMYLINYTSNQKWEKSKGICIISADKRNEAIKEFSKTIKERNIKSISLIKPKKGLIFNQDVSIL